MRPPRLIVLMVIGRRGKSGRFLRREWMLADGGCAPALAQSRAFERGRRARLTYAEAVNDLIFFASSGVAGL